MNNYITYQENKYIEKTTQDINTYLNIGGFIIILTITIGIFTYWKIMVMIENITKYFKYKNQEIEEKHNQST